MNGEPSAEQETAVARWARTVVDEHAQADRVRSDDPSADHWKKLAHRFEPATREKALQDETFQAVRRFARKTDTVLDVGAGAGRLAVPLAEICRQVTAVEPSEAMRQRLREQADAWHVTNLDIVGATWQEAEVEPADVVICAHVVYTVEQIDQFIEKLTASSRRDVLVVVFDVPAMSNYFPLWKLVHGEERIALPTLPQLEEVLEEMQIRFETKPLTEWQSRPFSDFENAYEESLARLFISPDHADENLRARVRSALERSLVESEDGLRFEWAAPHRPWLVHWNA